jgi:alanine dehydrogenase
MTLRVGVPKEVMMAEYRVALTPDGAEALREGGAEVVVQAGAGQGSGFPDSDYETAGAAIVPGPEGAWETDLVVKVKEPIPEEYPFLSEKAALFTYLHLAAYPALTDVLLEKKVTAIAYETVTVDGHLPLLRPMSEVAGILAVQAGARGLESINGGRGVLLPATSGTEPAEVCVIGAGAAGMSAVRMAVGMGASVTVLDTAAEKLERIAVEFGSGVRSVPSTLDAIAEAVTKADLVVSTVLVPGDRAPVLVSRDLVRRMRRGAVVVDVAIDQGGSVETARPTTHEDPFYVEEGVVHYCVTNMPGAVPRTSTKALTRETLAWVLKIARKGVAGALRDDPSLRAGLNTYKGKVTCRGVARALGKEYMDPEALL